ncbi:MAG: hypothetical protein ACQGVK_11545 [Myxococcota bacterium]
MRIPAILAIGMLLLAEAASAATWSIIQFSSIPQNAPAVLEAANALMGSEVGKTFPGRLFLQLHVADGDNPATHSFVPVYDTAADREAFVARIQDDPAWAAFQQVMTARTDPVSNVMYRTLKRWGDISDEDLVWRLHMFSVRDPGAFATALDGYMGSKSGQAFPGQVFLSGVVAGGLSPVTHAISVGYASEAEMEEWEKKNQGSADWAAYLEKSRAAADYLGNQMVRTLQTWGVSLDEVTD